MRIRVCVRAYASLLFSVCMHAPFDVCAQVAQNRAAARQAGLRGGPPVHVLPGRHMAREYGPAARDT